MYSVLILGATGTIGSKISHELSVQKSKFQRAAFLTPLSDAGPKKEDRYAKVGLERVVGSLSDSASYTGFDIVISAVGDDLCAQQHEFIDAAFKGGVKHFVPGECKYSLHGSDMAHPKCRDEAYFKDKVATRRHLEKRIQEDPELGYTYVMVREPFLVSSKVGLFSEYFFEYNILGLSEDKKSATFIGDPEARLTTTLSTDVAKFLIASLLPSHLPSLVGARELKVEGSTLAIRELFQEVEKYTGSLDIKYINTEESFAIAEEQERLGNVFPAKFVSAQRALGFGGSENVGVVNNDYPEITAMKWAETVKRYLGH
ncbi:hypothetical protein HYFRA_00003866 [Hymenoscyphus fraxineus]|uniref:NmrA-like domain-containing protein n=1 Tax=Hymenoscyphus fraxineus TaxID=746836 RepID=A0A9N9PUR3_9HELO|nr:hypothetical protein HYFRA_00003866 [Hymenoscyphus fraxineus]